MQGGEELRVGVMADAGFLVRGDVGGIDGAEGHVEGKAAGEGRAARRGVAGHAVRGMDEIFAALDLIAIRQIAAGTPVGLAAL